MNKISKLEKKINQEIAFCSNLMTEKQSYIDSVLYSPKRTEQSIMGIYPEIKKFKVLEKKHDVLKKLHKLVCSSINEDQRKKELKRLVANFEETFSNIQKLEI